MSRAKYDDFNETSLGRKTGKRYPWTEEEYIGITCPGCKTMFVEITAQSLKTSKASNCLKHLRENPECQAAFGHNVGEAPEKKRKYTNEDVMNEIRKVREEMSNEMTEKMERMEKRICTTVANICKVNPPPPTSEEELYDRLGDKQTDVDAERNKLRCMERNASNTQVVSQCSICLVDESSDVVTVPCMHRVMCWGCWQSVCSTASLAGEDAKCPTCREKVQHALHVNMH